MAKKIRSVLTDDMDHCFICRGKKEHIHHCLYGNKRKMAEKDKLVIPLCFRCHERLHHERYEALKYMKMAQIKYESIHGHEAYMRRYGKNYV